MTVVIRSLFVLAVLVCALPFAPTAQAQVIIYRLEFKHQDGFNVDYYNGGYLAAPLLGGTGSFLLTAVENGRRVLDTAPGAGSYFLSRSGDKRFNVVAATVGSGPNSSATGSYVAFGEVNRTMGITTPTGTYRIKVASTLKGESLAADDEDGKIKFNGSTGTANFSDLSITLDEGLTREYNEKGFTLEETTKRLTRVLRLRGYATPSTDSGGGTDGGGTGTGTGTTPGISTGTSGS